MTNPKDLVGASKAPLRYVPPALMIEASGPMEDGAIKYGPFNWRQYPVEVVTYVEAAIRHLFAFLDGQDNAEDSGHSHIGHAIAGLGIVADSKALGTLIDNRFTAGPAADMLRARDKSHGKPGPEATTITREALEGLVAQVPGLTIDWNGGDPVVTRDEPMPTLTIVPEHRGEYPPDTRVNGLLTCCGQSEHVIDCPQWR